MLIAIGHGSVINRGAFLLFLALEHHRREMHHQAELLIYYDSGLRLVYIYLLPGKYELINCKVSIWKGKEKKEKKKTEKRRKHIPHHLTYFIFLFINTANGTSSSSPSASTSTP